MRLKIFFSVFLVLVCSFLLQAQEERIIQFDVQLDVKKDRSIHVVEEIKVYAAGLVIRRGITRSLPEKRDMKGKTMRMRYDIIRVERDGQKESYFTRSGNGYRTLYIGEEDVMLPPGVYTYTIEYEVPNQVGLFEEYDEIYWNAVGTNVDFGVEKATCNVTLPAGASILQDTAYTGIFGSTGADYQVEHSPSGSFYQTTRALGTGEGFSIAIGFQKGIIEPPGLFQRFGTLITIIIGFLFLIAYFVYTWWKYGVDPPKPTAYPLYDAPDHLSPASINYIFEEKYQRKSFTASIIKLAIKGYLKIEEQEVKKLLFFKRKIYHLIKLKEADGVLPKEEQKIMETLFSGGRDLVEIDGEYHEYVEDAYNDHKANLKVQHRTFIREGHNLRFLTIPILMTIAVMILAVVLLVNSPFIEGINIIPMAAFVPVAIIGIILYAYLIKKPTEEKLELQSRIEGYKMYLEMAEKDRLRLLNPPEKTPEVFEQALPYAFALGVEHKWAEQFKDILEQAQYQPQWTNTHPIYFSNHFGNDFSKTLMSSATDPARDGGGGGFSGSGGGGFSGGGGGGGGVGGW
jgi:uncharacterized membrane protein YgcG